MDEEKPLVEKEPLDEDEPVPEEETVPEEEPVPEEETVPEEESLNNPQLSSVDEEKSLVLGDSKLAEFLNSLKPDIRGMLHTNDYDVTIARAKAQQYKSQTHLSLYKDVAASLTQILDWYLPKVVTRVQSLLAVYRQSKSIEISTTSVPEDMKRHTRILKSSDSTRAWDFAVRGMVLFEIAKVVNNYKINDGTGGGRGKGAKTVIYDQYIRSEFPNDNAFEQAARDTAAMKRRRDQWRKHKSVGDLLGFFIEEFGPGNILSFWKTDMNLRTNKNKVFFFASPKTSASLPLRNGQNSDQSSWFMG